MTIPNTETQNAALLCRDQPLDLSRPRVMGIVNVTPDSFSDGGRHFDLPRAVAHAHQLLADGADLLDIGGESTRPGSDPVPLDEELRRVVPLVEALRDCGAPLSVDTTKAEVMRQAVAAGAHLINDINALREEGALEAAAASGAAVCVMHMRGMPRTMQQQPEYADVAAEVTAFLAERVAACEAAGIGRERILVDPGFGFGKNLQHNVELFRAMPEMSRALGLPILAGVSRKTMLGLITGRPVGERLAASVTAAVCAAARGARILRVHDVRETVDALKTWQTLGPN